MTPRRCLDIEIEVSVSLALHPWSMDSTFSPLIEHCQIQFWDQCFSPETLVSYRFLRP